MLVLNDIFSYKKVKEAKIWYHDDVTYFDMALSSGSEEHEFFQFGTLDGDTWPAIPGVNKEGQAEIFGMDGGEPYHDFCDIKKTEHAYQAARNAVFSNEGILLSFAW